MKKPTIFHFDGPPYYDGRPYKYGMKCFCGNRIWSFIVTHRPQLQCNYCGKLKDY